jgi:hypothetical protein
MLGLVGGVRTKEKVGLGLVGRVRTEEWVRLGIIGGVDYIGFNC